MRLVVLDDWEGQWALYLRNYQWQHAVEVKVLERHLDWPALRPEVESAEILALNRERTPLTAEMIAHLPRLQLIAQTGTGLAHLDIDALQARGIEVRSTPGAGVESVVEHVLMMMLMLARQAKPIGQMLADGGWRQPLTRTLYRKTLGIVGLGQIGARLAVVANHLGMKVHAWGPTLTPERASASGAVWTPLADLAKLADFLSIHLRLNANTRGLLSADILDRMRPESYLINTARAGVLDMVHLREMVQSGRIAGVGLDVFEEEPLKPDDFLRQSPQAVLTPHIGWITDEVWHDYVHYTVQNVEDALRHWGEEGPVALHPAE